MGNFTVPANRHLRVNVTFQSARESAVDLYELNGNAERQVMWWNSDGTDGHSTGGDWDGGTAPFPRVFRCLGRNKQQRGGEYPWIESAEREIGRNGGDLPGVIFGYEDGEDNDYNDAVVSFATSHTIAGGGEPTDDELKMRKT